MPAWRPRPRTVLAMLIAAWLLLTGAIAVATPAYEANDEPDHLRNVETLVSGSWYRIEDGAGIEPHQPPLYYLLVAGWQKALGLPARDPAPPPLAANGGSPDHPGIHQRGLGGQDNEDRRAIALRVVGILLGALSIVLTYAGVGRLSSDPWTPVVAAGFVAGVPKLAFVSAVLNNDSLLAALGALGLLAGAAALGRTWERGRAALALALGAVAGALVITKLSALAFVPALLVPTLWGLRARPQLARAAGLFALGAVTLCGWWLVQNTVRYGSPLAADAAREHLAGLAPSIFATKPFFEQAFVEVPRTVWSSFWYTSGWNQFKWADWQYVPLWLLLAAGVALLVLARRRPLAVPPGTLPFLTAGALGTLTALWIVGTETATLQARVAFFGLPVIGALFALGLERARVPVTLRFVLPVLGLAGTFAALRGDVIEVFVV